MPWKLNHSELNPQVEDDNGNYVCQVWGYGTPEGRHNARLICAAPEMYKLLKEIGDLQAWKIIERIDKEG